MTSSYSLRMSWHQGINWFLGLSLLWQILIVGGIVIVAIVVIIAIYYILKGVGYLIYYPIKGIWWLLKRIFGKHKPKTQETEVKTSTGVELTPEPSETQILEDSSTNFKLYCPKCGNEFTDSMINQIKLGDFVYCVYCGNILNKNAIDATN